MSLTSNHRRASESSGSGVGGGRSEFSLDGLPAGTAADLMGVAEKTGSLYNGNGTKA